MLQHVKIILAKQVSVGWRNSIKGKPSRSLCRSELVIADNYFRLELWGEYSAAPLSGLAPTPPFNRSVLETSTTLGRWLLVDSQFVHPMFPAGSGKTELPVSF